MYKSERYNKVQVAMAKNQLFIFLKFSKNCQFIVTEKNLKFLIFIKNKRK